MNSAIADIPLRLKGLEDFRAEAEKILESIRQDSWVNLENER